MQRSFFQRLFAVALFAALFSLNSCQKDVELTPSTVTPEGTATQRNPTFFGVTVYGSPFKPSIVVELDEASGFVLNTWAPFFTLPGGGTVNITDIKGICYLSGGIKYAITTGPNNAPGVPNDALLTLNVATHEAFFLSFSTVGTVSDIDYDPLTGAIYGLANNSNNLVAITGGGFNAYTVTPITGLPFGATARGLTMIGDINIPSTQINIGLTQNGAVGTAQVYKVNPAGVSGFIANLLPAVELQGANCGMGYQLKATSQLYINRNTFTVVPGVGLNNVTWPPAGSPAATAVWGGVGFNFEDLSSDIHIP